MMTGKLNISGVTPTQTTATTSPGKGTTGVDTPAPNGFEDLLSGWVRQTFGLDASAGAADVQSGGAQTIGDGDFEGLGRNVSFFFRVSTTIRQRGEGLEDLFLRTSHSLADRFSRHRDWSGDPIGTYLHGTRASLDQGIAETKNYLQQVLAASKQGMQSVLAGLGSGGSWGGASPTAQGTSPASMFGNPLGGAFDVAYLRLTSAQDLGSSVTGTTSGGLGRPPARMADGHDLVMVAETDTPVADATPTASPQARFDFMEHFLGLVQRCLDVHQQATVRPARPTAVQIQISINHARMVPTEENTDGSEEPAVLVSDEGAGQGEEEQGADTKATGGSVIKGVGESITQI